MSAGPPQRDQDASPFAAILERLLLAVPGAVGAVLVDEFGEGVDYSGRLDPFDIRVAGAHWQLTFRLVNERCDRIFGPSRSLTVSASKRSYYVKQVIDEYVLVLVLVGGSAFRVSWRALYQAEFDLRVEAGWDPPEDIEQWEFVEVQARPHDGWRPHAVRGRQVWVTTEVMGAVVGLAEGERGFRVRLTDGKEVTLVREASGRWFADSPL